MMGPFMYCVCVVIALRYCFTEYQKGPSYFFEEIDELRQELKWERADRALYRVDPRLAIDLGFDPTNTLHK